MPDDAQEEGDAGRPLDELARHITQAAVRLAAATAAWLRLIAEFDERGGWHGVGIKSCAHWLAWQCGLGPGAAREHVRTARALQRLPLIDGAFAEGRLSYAKVRALTRIADPDCEADLLELAEELTASQVERVVQQWRRADRPGPESIQLKQDFHTWWDDDGMLVLRVRMPAEQGAALLSAVNSLAERAARRERALLKKNGETPAETGCDEDENVRLARERTTARRLGALAQLAEGAVDADRRAGDPPRREVIVHVDSALIDDDAAAGRAYLDGGPALHPSQARRMLCEANVVLMLEKDREVLAVGRTKRRATRAQRRALLRRDGGCARPGCPENRIERLHAHHLRHWLHGGRTDLANMVPLCDADHGLVHDLDLVMFRRDRELVVTTSHGRRVWAGPTRPSPMGWPASPGERHLRTAPQPTSRLTSTSPSSASSRSTAKSVGGPAAGGVRSGEAGGEADVRQLGLRSRSVPIPGARPPDQAAARAARRARRSAACSSRPVSRRWPRR